MTKDSYVDLEIGLYHTSPGAYSVELRLSHESEADRRWVQPLLIDLDLDALRQASGNMEEYGRLLGNSLFASKDMQTVFAHARALAESRGVPLRLRLFIEHGAAELHTVFWEALRNPEDGSCLLMDERVLFSRYLGSWDWRPVRARARSELRALVVISNPADLDTWKPGGRALAAVDVAGELERIRASLGGLRFETLASGGQATLDTLVSRLRDGHDILYLVCHGALVKGEPWLWLEDEEGKTARVAGSALVQRLRELQSPPRLVVLASCQSAGPGGEPCSGNGEVLSALGPRLAEAGVPAVLAMQGNVTMKTLERFMPCFFKTLQGDGQIDHAMTVARGEVRDRPDWWIPVLFMRLKSGRLWYVPGFGTDTRSYQKWPVLLDFIHDKKCTPLLGSGLVEPLLGSLRDLARRWAERYQYPMAPYECEDLSHVAQFLAINQLRSFPQRRLADHIRLELRSRYPDLPPDVGEEKVPLERLISEAGTRFRKSTPTEPHRVLAGLPCPIYVTTNFDDLLTDALREAGKSPRVEFCRWKHSLEEPPLLEDEEPNYSPDPKNPLVFHLFGRYGVPDSLVLTLDDHLDFLIGSTRNRDSIPKAVRSALTWSALLFIGFQLDALSFRVLFRTILLQEGSSRLSELPHVAAQVDPEEGRILEPEGARRYLESYFLKSPEINVYWGDTRNFLEELQSQWRASS